MSERPLITVGIPTYNRSAYLQAAVRSVQQQSLAEWELLITDNASTDDTPEVARRLAAADPRIRYVRNPANLGMAGNWKRLEELTTTPYLKYLMDDDLLLPGCLEALCQAAQAHPQCSLIACLHTTFDGPEPEPPAALPIYAPERAIPGPVMLDYLTRWSNQIGCPTNVMFRTDVLRQVSGLWQDNQRVWAPDFLAFALALNHGDFYCLNRPLVAIRVHGQSLTSTTADLAMQAEEEWALGQLAQIAGGSPEHRAHTELHVARAAFIRGLRNLRWWRVGPALQLFRRWATSPQAAGAAQMGISHSAGVVLKRLIPAPIKAARRRQRARLAAHPAGAMARPSTRYRYRGMGRFWQRQRWPA